MLITRTSLVSKVTRTLEIPCTEEQYFKWENGMSIQKAMPNISPADREFILNGITPEEWESIYPEDGEDDNSEEYYFMPSSDGENIVDGRYTDPQLREDIEINNYLERNGDMGISGFDDPNLPQDA